MGVGEAAGAALALYEAAHEVCGGCAQQLFGRGVLLYFAGVHDQHFGAEAQSLGDVVRDKEHGDARLLPDALELRLELGAGYLVHRAEWLIHQQQLGRGGEGAGYAHALLLSAGELVGVAALELPVQADYAHPLVHGLARALFVAAVEQVRHVGYVLLHAHVREQHAALDGVADVAAQLHLVHARYVLAVYQYRAGIGRQQAVHQLERRGLAAAGRADYGHELACFYAEIEVVEHGLVAVALADVPEFYACAHASASSFKSP